MKYSDFIKSGNTVSFRGTPVTIDEILDISNSYYPGKREIDNYPSLCNVSIFFKSTEMIVVPATALRPLRKMTELSWDEHEELWRVITYTDDFQNDLGVHFNEVAYYYDGYLSALHDDGEFADFEEDSAENFATYCSWFK